MSNHNRNNNQSVQATVDVKPEELKPVNNEKPEKVKMGFKERVFGWPKRHPVATERITAVFEGAVFAVVGIAGGYVGGLVASKDVKDYYDRNDRHILDITAATKPDDVEPDTGAGDEDTTAFD